MIDLTTSAGFFRRASVWIVISVVAFIVVLTVYLNRQQISAAFFPPKPLPATVAFGILPKFNLDVGFKPQSNVNYKLQTVTGELPALAGEAKVFGISKNVISFSSFDIAKSRAQKLGFINEPIEIGSNKLQFIDPNDSNRVLVLDALNSTINLESNYLTDTSVLAAIPRNIEEAKQTAINFFNSAGVSLSEYPADKIITQNFKVDGGTLVETPSLSTANLIRVDFTRADLDKLPVKSVRADASPVSALVSGGLVVSARYNASPIEKNDFATYPLKRVGKAFEDLKAGRAAYNKAFSGQSLTITSVSLGYLESDTNLDYLMPVYLFNVVGGFSAYVSAVDNSWMQK